MRRRAINRGLISCLGFLAGLCACPCQADESPLDVVPAAVDGFAQIDVEAIANAGIDSFFVGIENVDTAWRWLQANSQRALGTAPDAVQRLTAYSFSEKSLGLIVIIEGDLQPRATVRFLCRQTAYECTKLDDRDVHSWLLIATESKSRIFVTFYTEQCLVAGTSLDGLRESLAVFDGVAPCLANEAIAPSPDCLIVARIFDNDTDARESQAETDRRTESALVIRRVGERFVVSASTVCETDSEAQTIRSAWNLFRDRVFEKDPEDSPVRKFVEDCTLVIVGRSLEFRLVVSKRDLNSSPAIARTIQTGVRSGASVHLSVYADFSVERIAELQADPTAEGDQPMPSVARPASRLPPDPFEEPETIQSIREASPENPAAQTASRLPPDPFDEPPTGPTAGDAVPPPPAGRSMSRLPPSPFEEPELVSAAENPSPTAESASRLPPDPFEEPQTSLTDGDVVPTSPADRSASRLPPSPFEEPDTLTAAQDATPAIPAVESASRLPPDPFEEPQISLTAGETSPTVPAAASESRLPPSPFEEPDTIPTTESERPSVPAARSSSRLPPDPFAEPIEAPAE